MENVDILSIGDASIDVFLHPTDTETVCKIDTQECLICFGYGDKIPVSDLEITIGGNAANNAIGTKRLGLNSAILLTLGHDDRAPQIQKELEKERVNTKWVTVDGGVTNYSTVINYQGERTIFVYHGQRDYIFPSNPPTPNWVYVTSMGETFAPFYVTVAKWLESNPNIKIAYNPGSWQFKKWGIETESILKRTSLLFVNREEAEKITSLVKGNYDDKQLLMALHERGVQMPVITDGTKGAFLFDGQNKYLKISSMPIDAYERTGAGDAFGSGFLSAIIKGLSIEEAMIWGTVNSSSVIGYVGPQKGLLDEKNLGEWVQRCKNANVIPVEF